MTNTTNRTPTSIDPETPIGLVGLVPLPVPVTYSKIPRAVITSSLNMDRAVITFYPDRTKPRYWAEGIPSFYFISPYTLGQYYGHDIVVLLNLELTPQILKNTLSPNCYKTQIKLQALTQEGESYSREFSIDIIDLIALEKIIQTWGTYDIAPEVVINSVSVPPDSYTTCILRPKEWVFNPEGHPEFYYANKLTPIGPAQEELPL